MAADAWVLHDGFKLKKGNATINLAADSFVIRLATSASNITTTSVSDATTVTNELPTANGYTAGGQSVTSTWTASGNTVKFDVSDPSWTATGGSITARFAYLVNTTLTPDEVVGYTLLDNAPADKTATDGNSFTGIIHANGVFTE
jgi:hypothetical protein